MHTTLKATVAYGYQSPDETSQISLPDAESYAVCLSAAALSRSAADEAVYRSMTQATGDGDSFMTASRQPRQPSRHG